MSSTIGQSFVAKYLDPSEILGEILFGLIMVLTFTLGAGLVIQEGDNAIKEMLLAVIACNVAWGIIDAGMYVMTCVFERSRNRRLWRAVKAAPGDAQGLAIVTTWLEPQLGDVTSESMLKTVAVDVLGQLRQREPDAASVTRDDWYGAIASFWLVFLSTIPAVLPFLIFDSRHLALRVSNGLLLGMLFLVGYQWSRHTNERPWLVGLGMLACGGALVAVAIAFGA
jgi:VIT1/CCC1 family predicted Fe2+/Mn2+ transporter